MAAVAVTDGVAAATAVAGGLGLPVTETHVLHRSNKLTVRLLPCDVVARVAPREEQAAALELDLAGRLAERGCPVAVPDPRAAAAVHEHGDLVVTLWTHYPPAAAELPAAEYADALSRLHQGMRGLEVRTPLATDRVDEALELLADREQTPALPEPDRELLTETLHRLRPRIAGHDREQLIHGEPHPGNVLGTASGPVFIDFETCCRGPVEFDLAHAPVAVAEHYPGLDAGLLADCRILMLAMVTTWRWDRDDELPDGRRRGLAWMAELTEALAGPRP